MAHSKAPKDPQEDREPQRRQDFGIEEEADIDESALSPMSRAEADEEELAEDDLEELSEDDLRDMEGPDA